jgi:hypothetical protein
MSFSNSAIKRKRDEEKVSIRKVSFESRVEFPVISKKAAPTCWGKPKESLIMVKGAVVPISQCIEGDWTSGRLVRKEDNPKTMRFELPKTTVFSKKSVEDLKWEERNSLMREIFNCRAYGMKKPVGPVWDSYDDDWAGEYDDEWYRIEEGEEEE